MWSNVKCRWKLFLGKCIKTCVWVRKLWLTAVAAHGAPRWTGGGSPSCRQEWRPCGLFWSWAVASAPRRRTCASWDRTSPDPARWTEPGRPGRGRRSWAPGWTRGRWGWGCPWRRAELNKRGKESFRIESNKKGQTTHSGAWATSRGSYDTNFSRNTCCGSPGWPPSTDENTSSCWPSGSSYIITQMFVRVTPPPQWSMLQQILFSVHITSQSERRREWSSAPKGRTVMSHRFFFCHSTVWPPWNQEKRGSLQQTGYHGNWCIASHAHKDH